MAEPSSPEARKADLRKRAVVDEAGLAMVYEALGDSDPSVRREAAKLAARTPTNPALLLMLEKALCDDTSLSRRSTAMEALGSVGRPALPLLGRLAADPRAAVRRLAVDALGLTRVPEAVDILDKSARDAQPAVRAAALEAVARCGSTRSAAILMRAVDDRTEAGAVVLAALLGLLQLGKIPSVTTLRRRTEDPLTAGPALRLLGKAGEADLLLDVLRSTSGSRRKAAVLGLADALERARKLPVLSQPELLAILHELVDEGDVQVACAALQVAAWANDVDVLAQAAARDDRAHLVSAAHRAVAVLLPRVPQLAERLRVLAADDAPGADLLRELAESAERTLQRAAPAERSFTRALDDRSFSRLQRLFENAAGLNIGDDARVRVEARLLPRVDEAGVIDFASYVDLVSSASQKGRDELLRALELVTVHETYFFRERPQLQAFINDVVPELRALRRTDPVLHAWSAGSSTGEEAYTLSILLHEAGVRQHDVLGTDLSPDAIETATAGKFSPRSFRGEIDADVRRRWFIYELGGVRVTPELKTTTRFAVLNLLDESAVDKLPQFDVIFCRNVLIYMAGPARQRVIDLFYRRLRPGGVLFLGHSESLLHVDTAFSLRPLSHGLAYAKPETDGR